MKKTLQIISSTHARELNPLGKRPINPMGNKYKMQYEWDEAEKTLKEYRIECYACDGSGIFIDNDSNRVECPIHITYPIGSIHEFDTNEETLTCIVL